MNDNHHESIFDFILKVILWYLFIVALIWVITGICYVLGKVITSLWRYIILPTFKSLLKGFIWSYSFIIINERKLLRSAH